MKFGEKIKQKIWHFIYKFFPTIQKELLKLHLIWHQRGRQKYHIGYLKPGKTLEELKNHLHDEWGFGNHFVAWSDDSQVLSWRKLADFYHQYHLRIFSDGEIRGHFEYTPEGHPIAHFSVRKYPKVILMIKIRQLPPGENLAVIAPSHEMVAESPFVMQMIFKFFQGFAGLEITDMIFLSAPLMPDKV